jgi:hypothetical protein
VKIFPLKFQGDDRFFFNTTANVGLASPNLLEDVQLVQLGYFALTQDRANLVPEELKQAAAIVVPGAPYTGAPTDPLTVAIKAHQKVVGGPQDGHVSTIKGELRYDADHLFMLAAMMNFIRAMMGREFPRIDKHPKCPPALAMSVRRTFDTSRS